MIRINFWFYKLKNTKIYLNYLFIWSHKSSQEHATHNLQNNNNLTKKSSWMPHRRKQRPQMIFLKKSRRIKEFKKRKQRNPMLMRRWRSAGRGKPGQKPRWKIYHRDGTEHRGADKTGWMDCLYTCGWSSWKIRD